jgi:M6 family metalloprotease-like protein
LQKSRTDTFTRRKSAIHSGTGITPVILVDFSDLPAQPANTASVFNQMLFGTGAGAKTMATYYCEVSGGRFTVAAGPGGVVGWYRAAPPSVYYGGNLGSGPGVNDSNVLALVKEAVAAANAAGFDFAPYDQDGDGKVDVVNIIHAGAGEETGGGTPPNAIWSHRSSLGAQAVSYDGVTIDDYIIQPELSGPGGGLNTIGVFCHEYGHALGLPDLYDTDYTSNGVGLWSLMSSGNYLNGGRTPAHMDAWCKWKLGWITPTRYTFNAAGVEIKNAETNPSALFLWQNGVQGGEYFLVENRQLVGFDLYLPQAGLLIWHVDDTQTSNANEWYPGHTSSGHYWVALEQADGKLISNWERTIQAETVMATAATCTVTPPGEPVSIRPRRPTRIRMAEPTLALACATFAPSARRFSRISR